MKEAKFNDEQAVKIAAHADYKYNNRRGGAAGVVNDVYHSEKYDEFVYEIGFDDERGGYELIREPDLVAL
jgi:hypothetical protein